MIKHVILSVGLCALAFSAAPVAAQDAAAGQCKAAAASTDTGFKDNVRTARELGSRAAVGRRLQADGKASNADTTEVGGMDIIDGIPGETNADPTAAARMKCQNNLKQMGTANTGQ